ncbi:hypothetical protein RA263_11220 [Pseudomonas syringae pv. tagetis]|uniref:Uncharacterized protein n=1 Tax=Pseudomonas syringae pv. tagetis TaxID=129140 RepID=A0ABW7NML4_9PSED|nr:hypothetical protein [Pseudomonas syringae group genomosp. 7]UNB71382.1 hypothetical protein MME58_13295 [Pseudomonas syringae pv. tagetis]
MSKNDSVANLAKKNHSASRKTARKSSKGASLADCCCSNSDSTGCCQINIIPAEKSPETALVQAAKCLAQSMQYSICEFHALRTAFFEICKPVWQPCIPDLDAHYATTLYLFSVADASSPDSLDDSHLRIGIEPAGRSTGR